MLLLLALLIKTISAIDQRNASQCATGGSCASSKQKGVVMLQRFVAESHILQLETPSLSCTSSGGPTVDECIFACSRLPADIWPCDSTGPCDCTDGTEPEPEPEPTGPCVAVPGNAAGPTDAECATACELIGVGVWPCDAVTDLCKCDGIAPEPEPEPPTETCKPYCLKNTRDWNKKCTWGDCVGCSACGSFPEPEPEPEPAPEPPTGTCKPFCSKNTKDWKTKCTWGDCVGCSACGDLPADPTPLPTTSSAICKPYCSKNTKDWKTKCTWDDCVGCSACGDLPVDPTPLPTASSAICKPYCSKNIKDWKTKCTWDDCVDCSECRDLEPSPTAAPIVSPTALPTPAPTTADGDSLIDTVIQSLESSESSGVFMYDTGSGWLESDIYTWSDMIKAVRVMATTGVGKSKLWMGEAGNHIYGLVNIAAFLAQCMQETIQYNACDENNWSGKEVVAEAGGSTYSATAACGQLHQSYQDYQCSAEEDELADGQMACDVDADMEMRATTQAGWYGAPAKLFCAPKSKVPKAPRWDYTTPWCAPEENNQHIAPFEDDIPLDTYFDYVNNGGSCKDYEGIKTGGWKFSGEGCVNGACPGSPAPLFGVPEGRIDVEGCCWWGRGVIQTTGVCNFGKLNYFLGKRAAQEGRSSIYPDIDFCKNPGAICEPDGPGELKWVAGFFYWLNAVQPYTSGEWNYMDELKKWVDGGMNEADVTFINGASGIVNRGCHNPPNCGTGELHGGSARVNNFRKVLRAMGL